MPFRVDPCLPRWVDIEQRREIYRECVEVANHFFNLPRLSLQRNHLLELVQERRPEAGLLDVGRVLIMRQGDTVRPEVIFCHRLGNAADAKQAIWEISLWDFVYTKTRERIIRAPRSVYSPTPHPLSALPACGGGQSSWCPTNRERSGDSLRPLGQSVSLAKG